MWSSLLIGRLTVFLVALKLFRLTEPSDAASKSKTTTPPHCLLYYKLHIMTDQVKTTNMTDPNVDRLGEMCYNHTVYQVIGEGPDLVPLTKGPCTYLGA